jgi:hypothetical protein
MSKKNLIIQLDRLTHKKKQYAAIRESVSVLLRDVTYFFRCRYEAYGEE